MGISLLRQVRDILERNECRPKRRLGQNFLIDPDFFRLILEVSALGSQEMVVEIGPGLGILTRALCEAARTVLAIEIDVGLCRILEKEMGDLPNLYLVRGDALGFDFEAWFKAKGQRAGAKVVANLPYYISTPVLFHLLKYRRFFSFWILMVQREVGERLIANPGTKQYGSLTIALRLHADLDWIASVPKEAFYPRPQVDSALLRIRIRPEPRVKIEDESLFASLVRSAFSQRRKMLRNVLPGQICPGLKKEVWDRVFTDADICPQRRGESLSIEEFARFAHHLHGWLKREGYVSYCQG